MKSSYSACWLNRYCDLLVNHFHFCKSEHCFSAMNWLWLMMIFYFFVLPDSDSLSSSESEAHPTRGEIFCNSQEQDKFLPDHGTESSLLMDMDPGKTINSCKRFFTAPVSSGLYIQLIKKDLTNDSLKLSNAFSGSISNVTQYCPISIVSYAHDLDTELIHSPSQSTRTHLIVCSVSIQI